MATLDRNGVKLHYEVHGDVPVFLLTHGYSATAQMWQGQIAPLAARHKLVLWDMRGDGQSDSPDDPALYSRAATVADMAAIRVPSLVVVGSEDKPFLAASDYMAGKIPGARKVVIDGAGHAANIDRPEAFNAALLAFLDTLTH